MVVQTLLWLFVLAGLPSALAGSVGDRVTGGSAVTPAVVLGAAAVVGTGLVLLRNVVSGAGDVTGAIHGPVSGSTLGPTPRISR